MNLLSVTNDHSLEKITSSKSYFDESIVVNDHSLEQMSSSRSIFDESIVNDHSVEQITIARSIFDKSVVNNHSLATQMYRSLNCISFYSSNGNDWPVRRLLLDIICFKPLRH